VLGAHPGESQGRPRKLSSSKLIPGSTACPFACSDESPMSQSGNRKHRTGHHETPKQSHPGRKLVSPPRRRAAVLMLQDRLGLSERRAC
jgi:hypothetical protein